MIYQDSFFLYLFIPLLIVFIFDATHGFQSGFGFFYSSGRNIKFSSKSGLLKLARISRYIAISFLILAIANPQSKKIFRNINFAGVDIFVVLDISESMGSEDFKPKNRLQAAKTVIKKFISKRSSDRIGLIVFAGEAYLQCPLTLDYGVLKSIVHQVDFSSVQVGGTAIGNAVALASSLLYKSPTKSKIIILLTDGVNNRGIVDPITIAQAAAKFNIKIYTIGIGSKGHVTGSIRQADGHKSSFNFYDHYDEEMLIKIANITNGQFFSAVNANELYDTIKKIDRLEKTIFQRKKFFKSKLYYHYFAWIALIILLISLMVEKVYVQRFP